VLKYLKYHSIFFFFLRKIKKNCKDLGVGQDLTEFVKISMLEFLKIYIYIFRKKRYFENFDRI
jgi:hypothetical protein